MEAITTEAFNKSLTQKAESDRQKFLQDIGAAIQPIVDRYGLDKGLCFTFSFSQSWSDYVAYGRSGYTARVSVSGEQDEKIRKFFQTKSMEQFQEALQSFAWAVRQQQNNGGQP